jgi:hypothetical protein
MVVKSRWILCDFFLSLTQEGCGVSIDEGSKMGIGIAMAFCVSGSRVQSNMISFLLFRMISAVLLTWRCVICALGGDKSSVWLQSSNSWQVKAVQSTRERQKTRVGGCLHDTRARNDL